jgi:small conductance mechanosensitive channel
MPQSLQQEVQKNVQMVQTAAEHVVSFLINYGFEVVGAFLILFVGFKASQWAAAFSLRFLERRQCDLTVARFAAGTIRGLVLGFAAIAALGKFGITIAPIVAAISAVAFGGTFALQGVLSNMGSGLSLLLFRPFKVGDTIEVAGVTGIVEEVKLGCTILTNEDGERLTVPNRHIIGEIVRNSFGCRLAEAVVGISYDDDPARAVAVLGTALRQVPGVAPQPAPIIGIREFADSAIQIGVRYWVPTPEYFQVCGAVNLALFQALKAAGLTMPFPQRDVRLVTPKPQPPG